MIQTAPDVTRLIDRLVKAGLARRGKSPDDGRLSLTFITDKGLKLLARMQPEIEASEAEMAGALTRQQAKNLSELCERLIART